MLENRIRRFIIFILSCVFCLLFVCEYLVYYVKIKFCHWPSKFINNNTLRAVVIADTHLLGLIKGHWFDKLRREWQMRMTYRCIYHHAKPDAVFILGDLFDEGQWADNHHFENYMYTYKSIFNPSDWVKIYGIVGNHDVGFHYHIIGTNRYFLKRFMKRFQSKQVELHIIKENIFVMINSMAFEGDNCVLCQEAALQLENISSLFKCIKEDHKCHSIKKLYAHSKPIILQHFPMFRNSSNKCLKPIANTSFKPKYDCLSNEASIKIFHTINPRLVLSGHTHFDCEYLHSNMIPELTLGSFNWRNTAKPSFLLLETSPSNFTTTLCYGPNENVILATYYIIFGTIAILFIWKILNQLWRKIFFYTFVPEIVEITKRA